MLSPSSANRVMGRKLAVTQIPEKTMLRPLRLLSALVLFVTSGGLAQPPQTTIPTAPPPSVHNGATHNLALPIVVAPSAVLPAPAKTILSNNNQYVNRSGTMVRSSARCSSVPTGASAICGDGSYSFSRHRQGTCSHHGGVARWM
jgi:hypothetical protein